MTIEKSKRISNEIENIKDPICFADPEHIFRNNEVLRMFDDRDYKGGLKTAALIYLLTLSKLTYDHLSELFDFQNNCIKKSALDADWQTVSSKALTLLAFNIFDSNFKDFIFCNALKILKDYRHYYYQAIDIASL